MTKAMQDYYKDLARMQNYPKLCVIDIMTITGFMDDTAKIKHLLDNAKTVGDKAIIAKWTNKTTI